MAVANTSASFARIADQYGSYEAAYRASIDTPESFWAEQAKRIYWHEAPQHILDTSNLPFRRWFVGGKTNLCYNAVDRHAASQPDTLALVSVSTETNVTREISYAELRREVTRFAAVLVNLGVGQGDRVVIYMPNVAEAVFAMLACARLGAIHSVVFGGFAAHNLATRIDDCKPKVLITADAGMRGGKVIRYKPLVDEAVSVAKYPPAKVLVVSRGLDPEMPFTAGRDEDYRRLAENVGDVDVPVTWLDANDTSYLLYTSGTTGKPKGIQRDVGGYAVALALSMETIFDVGPGQTMFCTSDVGWAVGHSYNVYGPLLVGATAMMYEGLPFNPDAGIWWSLCEKYNVRTMFSSPTAIRILKKYDADCLTRHDLSSLQYLFLAGEPLDEPTARWINGALKKPIIDNYWQTETGWPALALHPGVELRPVRFGSPGLPNFGYRLRVLDEHTGKEVVANQKGVLVFDQPLPPGFMTTIWNDNQRFVDAYFGAFGSESYSSLDWAIKDEDGYTFILGRTDDVINVAGHRLGTRELEEASTQCSRVAEAAVVGVPDEIKGQVPVVFATLRSQNSDEIERNDVAKELVQIIEQRLGAIARPARIYIVPALPKTRSGKLLRRVIQALSTGANAGDMSTIEDPDSVNAIISALARGPDIGQRPQ